jgi:hypothetical protein
MHSPVKSNVLNKELIGYNTALRNYLVSGFQYGFTCASIKKNVDKISDLNEGNGHRSQNYFETYSTWI